MVSKSTRRPNSAWVLEQAQSFVRQTDHREHRPTILIHDRETKFSSDFRSTLKDAGVECMKFRSADPISTPGWNDLCRRSRLNVSTISLLLVKIISTTCFVNLSSTITKRGLALIETIGRRVINHRCTSGRRFGLKRSSAKNGLAV